VRDPAAAEAAMVRINELLIRNGDKFFGYERPTDFRLEERHPQLYPTNVRPETLAQDAAIKQQAAEGKLAPAQFLRFTSPERSPYRKTTWSTRAGIRRRRTKIPKRPKQAIVVLPQWNSDGFSHNSLCTLFNRMGVSALRLSMPYHDIRRPAELERSDYSVSANIGRTLAACRQAVVDIRCCLDWLEEQGYEHFGVLGTSLGSCYAFLASTYDKRIRVNAFNHASTAFGDVTWAGQSTRHVKQALEEAGLTQDRVRALWSAVSPCSYYERFAGPEAGGPDKKVLLVYADYDLTFPGSIRCRWWRRSSITASTSSRACCRAATTPPAKRRTSSSTAGIWAGLSTGRSRRCAKRRQPHAIRQGSIQSDADEQSRKQAENMARRANKRWSA
jgi:hypothetical protein